MLATQLDAHRAPVSLLEGEAATLDPGAPETVADGHPALLPNGVLYHADWHKAEDGIHRHARESMLALAAVGVPVRSHQVSAAPQQLVPQDVEDAVGWMRNVSLSSSSVAIRHGIFSAHALRAVVLGAGRHLPYEAQRQVLANTIICTSWERDRVAADAVEMLNELREVWVPCEANRVAFERSGVARVFVIPCPYQPSAASSAAFALPRGTGETPPGRRFYHIGKWEPRKDQVALLRAFLRAFTPEDRALLTIKTSEWGSWENYASIHDAKRECAQDPIIRGNGWTADALRWSVQIIDRKLSAADIMVLHKNHNIYVSPSHGEAWDLPAFDAKCAGNRLVHVGYGGSEDYAEPGDVTVPHAMGPVHPGYGWETDAQWAVYELDALVEALRAARPPGERVHPPTYYHRFSRFAVGMRMHERLGGAAWTHSYG